MSTKKDEAPDFVWKIIELCFLEDSLEKTFTYIETKLADNTSFPINIYTFLYDFLENKKYGALIEMALWCARNYYFDIDRHAILVSILLSANRLTQKEGLELLTLTHDRIHELSPDIEKVMDIVWLLNEDSKDGVMEPDQDSLFKITLLELLEKSKLRLKIKSNS